MFDTHWRWLISEICGAVGDRLVSNLTTRRTWARGPHLPFGPRPTLPTPFTPPSIPSPGSQPSFLPAAIAGGQSVAVAAPHVRAGWAAHPLIRSSASRSVPLLPLPSALSPQPSPEDEASLWSRLTFAWVGPLIRLGNAKVLRASDLPPLCPRDSTAAVAPSLKAAWHAETTANRRRPSLPRALVSTFMRPFMAAGALKLIHDLLQLASPLLLQQIILHLSMTSFHVSTAPPHKADSTSADSFLGPSLVLPNSSLPFPSTLAPSLHRSLLSSPLHPPDPPHFPTLLSPPSTATSCLDLPPSRIFCPSSAPPHPESNRQHHCWLHAPPYTLLNAPTPIFRLLALILVSDRFVTSVAARAAASGGAAGVQCVPVARRPSVLPPPLPPLLPCMRLSSYTAVRPSHIPFHSHSLPLHSTPVQPHPSPASSHPVLPHAALSMPHPRACPIHPPPSPPPIPPRTLRCPQVRTAMVALIYSKALRISAAARHSTSLGEIVNLQSNDAEKLAKLCIYLHIVWSGPLQIIGALALLFRFLSVIPALAGLATMLLLMPFNGVLMGRLSAVRHRLIARTDARVRLLSEAVGAMRALKLNGWEALFKASIEAKRAEEMREVTVSVLLGAWEG
ncbi:unnamed protein product [Closterium sp. Yama58-4]|nr:unnamed protein product [Closterium sp. Yama58-4]